MNNLKLNTIEEIISDITKGKVVIIVDDENREAEGDFICSANHATPEIINFMASHGRGLICTALSLDKVAKLGLSMMPATDNSHFPTAFTISVDAVKDTTTGISARDRSITSKLLADKNSTTKDFSSPGHSFPLKAVKGGVLVRAGHTEAGVDLANLAGQEEATVICEIMNEDGTMARLPQLIEIAKKHNLKISSIEKLIEYRRKEEKLVCMEASPEIPTKHGTFKAFAYRDKTTGAEHLALVKGEIKSDEPTNVRVHSECLTGDTLGSLKCDCGEQLNFALKYISENNGVVLYMRNQEGRGIGLVNKMKAYELQKQGLDTVEANLKLGLPVDNRNYGIGAQILSDLGVRKMNLLTNNPDKITGLSGYGLEIVKRIPIEIQLTQNNGHYLRTKRDKMNHFLKIEE